MQGDVCTVWKFCNIFISETSSAEPVLDLIQGQSKMVTLLPAAIAFLTLSARRQGYFN
jgi:hypothetical protein